MAFLTCDPVADFLFGDQSVTASWARRRNREVEIPDMRPLGHRTTRITLHPLEGRR